MFKIPKPSVLIILDGFGIGPNNQGNAIARSNISNLPKYFKVFPHTQLIASGEAVGLPAGEPGSTEVGHLNIGAGTIVYQNKPRIDKAIENKTFFQNPVLKKAIQHAKNHNSNLHIMGLVGEGKVHSDTNHLIALLKLCSSERLRNVYVHAFTDGRDSSPRSAAEQIAKLQKIARETGAGKIASVMGRFYAMDRDKKWDRVQKAYDTLTMGSPKVENDPVEAIKKQYTQNITDEFIEPTSILVGSGAKMTIRDNDAVIFFNFRIDRPRELTRAFVLKDFENSHDTSFDPFNIEYEKTHIQKSSETKPFKRKKTLTNLFFVTMTQYEENLPVQIAFPPQEIQNPLGKVFSDLGLRQLRITETEKEKFVTYYMNGGKEIQFKGEDRIIIPSKGVKSYDEAPEMSAREITREMLKQIDKNIYDVIICNFANADMVGHTGNIQAAIQSIKTLDNCLKEIVQEVGKRGGMVIITADHGNAEEMINNQTGEIDTKHSFYPVPFIVISKEFLGRDDLLPRGILSDVAPTMLDLMGLEIPKTMTGQVLFKPQRSPTQGG